MKNYKVVVATAEGTLVEQVVQATSMSAVEAKYGSNLKSIETASDDTFYYCADALVSSRELNSFRQLGVFLKKLDSTDIEAPISESSVRRLAEAKADYSKICSELVLVRKRMGDLARRDLTVVKSLATR